MEFGPLCSIVDVVIELLLALIVLLKAILTFAASLVMRAALLCPCHLACGLPIQKAPRLRHHFIENASVQCSNCELHLSTLRREEAPCLGEGRLENNFGEETMQGRGTGIAGERSDIEEVRRELKVREPKASISKKDYLRVSLMRRRQKRRQEMDGEVEGDRKGGKEEDSPGRGEGQLSEIDVILDDVSNGQKGEDKSRDLSDELRKLKEELQREKENAEALRTELEAERSASDSAAVATLDMIQRLREEKSMIEMETRQRARIMEEKASYDEEAIEVLRAIVVKQQEELDEMEMELRGAREGGEERRGDKEGEGDDGAPPVPRNLNFLDEDAEMLGQGEENHERQEFERMLLGEIEADEGGRENLRNFNREISLKDFYRPVEGGHQVLASGVASPSQADKEKGLHRWGETIQEREPESSTALGNVNPKLGILACGSENGEGDNSEVLSEQFSLAPSPVSEVGRRGEGEGIEQNRTIERRMRVISGLRSEDGRSGSLSPSRIHRRSQSVMQSPEAHHLDATRRLREMERERLKESLTKLEVEREHVKRAIQEMRIPTEGVDHRFDDFLISPSETLPQ